MYHKGINAPPTVVRDVTHYWKCNYTLHARVAMVSFDPCRESARLGAQETTNPVANGESGQVASARSS